MFLRVAAMNPSYGLTESKWGICARIVLSNVLFKWWIVVRKCVNQYLQQINTRSRRVVGNTVAMNRSIIGNTDVNIQWFAVNQYLVACF